MSGTIETKEVMVHLGWKVYIEGEKFPKEPQDFYGVISEESAIMRAMRDYQKLIGDKLKAQKEVAIMED